MSNPKVQIVPLRKVLRPLQQERRPSSTPPPRQSAVKQTRTSRPKVRTGCQTCRIRRVKCDEAKPECVKCASTGRKCDGYTDPPPRRRVVAKKSIDPALSRNPGVPIQTSDEVMALSFFHEVTAVALSTYFDAHYLTRMLFQLSTSEPAIRHGMTALGALSETRDAGKVHLPHTATSIPNTSFPGWNRHSMPDDAGYKFASGQYVKAISALGAQLRGNSPSVEVALMACMLFVCIEVLRGHAEPGLRHIKSGVGIAMTAIANRDLSQNHALRDIRDNVLPFFDRVELLLSSFGQPIDWEYRVPLSNVVPSKFENVQTARDSIIHLLNLCSRTVNELLPFRYTKVPPQYMTRYETMLECLETWKRRTNILLFADRTTPLERKIAKSLNIHRLNTKIWLHLALRPDEVYADKLIPEFEEMVDLAEEIKAITGTFEQRREQQYALVFNMETTSPMYTACLKCRHPVIRRRATALLKNTSRQVGLWDTEMAAVLSERLMAMEERHMTMLDGSQLPGEAERVHTTQIESEPGPNPLRHTVTFFTKPHGLDGPWHSWREEVMLVRKAEDMAAFSQHAGALQYKQSSQEQRQVSAGSAALLSNFNGTQAGDSSRARAEEVAALKKQAWVQVD